MKTHKHSFLLSLSCLCMLALIAACGGGGGTSTSSTGTDTKNSATANSNNYNTPSYLAFTSNLLMSVGELKSSATTPNQRVEIALATGESTLLMPEDLPYLLSSAQGNQQQVVNTQNQLLAGFYSGGASAKFDMVQESYLVQPLIQAMDNVFPLVVGDKGNVIASISTVGGGRIAGYGYDILAGFSPTSKQQTQYQIPQTAHQPVFKRVLAWLVSGNPLMDLTGPSTQAIKVAWGSLPTSSTVMYTQGGVNVYEPFAAAGLRTLGVKFTSATCDPLSAPVSECAAKSQLVVVGATDQSDAGKKLLPTQLDRLKEIIQQKIPILYMNAHPSPRLLE